MIFSPIVNQTTIVLFLIAALALCVWGFLRASSSNQDRAGLWRLVGRRAQLSRAHGKENPALTWIRRAAIACLVALVLAGPSIKTEETQVTSNTEIIFAVDRTGSMAAEDGPGGSPRLDAVRGDLVSMLEATAGSRYAIVIWDSSSRIELPFTTDGSAVQSFAEVLHQEISEFSDGSSLDRPVPTLLEILQNAKEQRPQNIRFLVVISDGEITSTQSGDAQNMADAWAALTPYIDGGVVLGYGTEAGGTMRTYRAGEGLVETDGEAQYITDPNAEPGGPTNAEGEPLAVSRADMDTMEKIAGALGVDLLANGSPAQIQSVGEGFMQQAELLEERQGTRGHYRYVTWIPAALAACLLVWEVASDAREVARLRRSGAI